MLLNLQLDPITMQSMYQQLFEDSHFSSLSSPAHSKVDTCTVVEFTPNELNVLRYACGFVALSSI